METTKVNTGVNSLSSAIISELEQCKDRSAWSKAVTAYAIELAETLDNWDNQPQSIAELKEMLLNGASDWEQYSYGGSSLIYDWDIAQRVCSPSELKRVTRKDGSLRDMANSRENWVECQGRALFQAYNRVINIAAKYINV